MFKKVNNPILFQGDLNKKKYFEGWYYKQVSLESKKVISFIPGISLNKRDPHAFIQIIEAMPVQTYYFKYDINDFKFGNEPFYIKIGNSIFSRKGVSVSIKDSNYNIQGEVTFGDFQSIGTSLYMPNIMGPFAYLPNMDCNHGVVSMNHSVDGKLEVNHDVFSFEKDKGYLEKDWGKTFPNKYIWLQGNNFKNPNASFMCSIANVPFMGVSFTGLIANLNVDGIEYRFATYNNSKILKVAVLDNITNITLKRGDITLHIEARVSHTGELKAPINGEMNDVIKEGLGGKISLKLISGKRTLNVLETEYAGIETVGNWN